MKLCADDCVPNCANCKFWDGEIHATEAFCDKQKKTTSDMDVCNQFYCSNANNGLILVK